MIATILGDEILREQLIRDLLSMAVDLGIPQILISFPTLSADRSELYSAFLFELGLLLRPWGVSVSLSLFEGA